MTIGSFGSNAFSRRHIDLKDDGGDGGNTGPPDIPPPPPSSEGLGGDWMLAQRDATYDAARETTVQARLQIRYRITPVFSEAAPPQTLSTPPNITALPLVGS
jgi:hypothetical protein